MTDSIVLKVGGKVFRNWLSYQVDADMYAAAGAFAFECARPDVDIAVGAACTLEINGELAMTGYIDKQVRIVDKTQHRLEYHGRDMMGAIVDWQLAISPDLSQVTLETLTQALLALVPIPRLKQVRYSTVASKAKAHEITAMQRTLGQSICDALRGHAKQFGLLFMALPDGTLCYTTPRSAGSAKYKITMHNNGRGNNAKTGHLTKDLSRWYKSIQVVSDLPSGSVSKPTSVVMQDSCYPSIGIPKLRVVTDDTELAFLDYRVKFLISQQRHQGFVAEYTVPGHTNNGKLWAINEFCDVDDEMNGLHGPFLVIGRTFSLTRTEGRTTKVRLSLPGA